MRSMSCPVWLARISLIRDLRKSTSCAWISMSVAWPWKPPEGWWIMIRVLGRAKRMPLVPPARIGTAIDAASPMQIVLMRGLMYCIVS